jgi:hypothetical protein
MKLDTFLQNDSLQVRVMQMIIKELQVEYDIPEQVIAGKIQSLIKELPDELELE